MFRHEGKARTYSNNLKLASLLSCVAGIVNITSVLKLNTLTTNITGHFAFLSEELVLKNYHMAIVSSFYVLFFLLGAFTSSLIIEYVSRNKPYGSYIIPLAIEISLLLTVIFINFIYTNQHLHIILSSILLFSMGLQNALVTRISQSVVRTTHLTGLITDLGIELSRIFFTKKNIEKIQIEKSVFLKLVIISCFVSGGLVGGFLFSYLNLNTLFLPIIILFVALWYDSLLFRYYLLKRKMRNLH